MPKFNAGQGNRPGVMNLGGRGYQTVALRIAQFWADRKSQEPGSWSLTTTNLHTGDPDRILFRAEVHHKGQLLATGHAEEFRSSKSKMRIPPLENCETSAIGRALATLGYCGNDEIGYSFASANEVERAQERRDPNQERGQDRSQAPKERGQDRSQPPKERAKPNQEHRWDNKGSDGPRGACLNAGCSSIKGQPNQGASCPYSQPQDNRWSSGNQRAFFARWARITRHEDLPKDKRGLLGNYEELARACEQRGMLRPSSMSVEQRAKLLDSIEAENRPWLKPFGYNGVER